MKQLFSLIATLLIPLSAMAQNLKTPTLDDLMWSGSNYWNLQPRPVSTTWWGDALLQTEVESVKMLRDPQGKAQSQQLFTLSDINAILPLETKSAKLRTLQNCRFPFANQSIAEIQTPDRILRYDWKKKTLTWHMELERHIANMDFHPGTAALAYTKGFNLFVQTAQGKRLAVSTDGNRELLYGTSVHRDEFGIHKGTFWSPQGDKLAFYRMDQSMVTDFPLPNIQVDQAQRVAQTDLEKYPMAGMSSHKVRVGVFNVQTGQSLYLQTGDETDRYFTNIAWSPDGSTIYMYELPRSQNRADLVAYDATTGQRKGLLFSETNERYVEPEHPIVFLPWDASKFLAWSERDGFTHLYLHEAKTGKLLRQITKGEFVVMDLLGFDAKNKNIIVRSNESGHLRANLYAVSLNTGQRLLLDNGLGMHNASLSKGGAFLVDTWSSPDRYREITVRSTQKNKSMATLLQADSPWKDYSMPKIEMGSLKANDGKTPLYYRVVQPVDFDPNKKYPTVVYVYGGPHATNVKESWNYQARPWEYYMANKGFVVFVLDNRGSDHRGFAFESIIHRQLGKVEMEDQMTGVAHLLTLPYVDKDRIGVHGWSYGGFMTTNLMLHHPEVFKVGVAGGPVLDWKYYEVMYGERYMDTPTENPEGYAAASMVEKAGQLKGRLQIIVGLNDPTCVLQHSLAFLRAAIDAGTQPDYFVYPGQGHNMMGQDAIHLHERITRYFEDYLK